MSAFEIIAEGLQFPEGPIAMPDGSVILVEVKRGALTRVWNGKRETIADIGGGPNGAAIGPDGAVYICNNGGFAWHDVGGLTVPGRAAADYTTGRIERVELSSGKVERLYDAIDGKRLSGPNDLVFDRAGGFWFTDLGKDYARSTDRGGLYYAKTDGSSLREAAYGYVGLNGVGLAADEQTVYAAETETARLWAFDIMGEGKVAPGAFGLAGRVVATQQSHVYFDSLAVQANGDLCVATLGQGGITTITPQGVSHHTPLPDRLVTNVCFGGADMRDAYVTLSSTGRLLKMRWPESGQKLHFNPY